MTGFKISNTTIPGTQIDLNTETTETHATDIAVGQSNLLVSGSNYSANFPSAGNSVDNLFKVLCDNGFITAPAVGRTITFNNNTSATNLDLYLTVGGTNPLPLTKLATINTSGSFMWPIPEIHNWTGNFTTLPAGASIPKFNAGPTIAEFGFNQVWSGFVPEIRDTFDISTVPSGIGTGANDGPRSLVVQLSRDAGFSIQQSFNYNVGVQIVPPAGVLPVQTVTCNVTDGNSPDSITFPNDTAFPKQQTAEALGSYIVNLIDPVVSLS
jgi:hypothetical protein